MVAVVAAGLTLKDVIQYGAEANHIADRIGQSTKASDLPVEELKTLITNGGLDILLAGVGYAGGKLAPKFIKLGDDALKLTDDVARKFDDAYRATKGKVAELANKVDDALAPGMVTTEGIVIKPKRIDELINKPMEARWEYRINLRRGDGGRGTGTEYAWRRHGTNGNPVNKSIFSISRADAEALLQRKDVIQAPAVFDPKSGNYIREVDVGRSIDRTPLKHGGQLTSVITVITDKAGNLVNYFPGRLDYGATLP